MLVQGYNEAIAFIRRSYPIRLVPTITPGGPDYPNADEDDQTYDAKTAHYDEVRDWCVEQFGWHMIASGENRLTLDGRSDIVTTVDLSRRWILSHYFFAFRFKDDAFAFKMRWPCRAWTENDELYLQR